MDDDDHLLVANEKSPASEQIVSCAQLAGFGRCIEHYHLGCSLRAATMAAGSAH
jgi:hypothetical protein